MRTWLEACGGIALNALATMTVASGPSPDGVRAGGGRQADGVTDGQCHVFVGDLKQRITEVVDVGDDGKLANGPSDNRNIHLSSDGRFVAFCSSATNLVPGDTNGKNDVFCRDRKLGPPS